MRSMPARNCARRVVLPYRSNPASVCCYTTMRRTSGHSTKSTKGRMRVTRGSKGAVSQPARRPETRQSTTPATALDAGPSLAERVGKERAQIFKALSIVECCWHATVTKRAVDDQEYMI